MTTEAHTILALLAHYGESYGLDLIRRSDGRLKRGTIYVHLDRMEDEGLVFSDLEHPVLTGGTGPRRRVYRISELGERMLANA